MDMITRPQIEVKVPLRQRAFYALVEWVDSNRKWLPDWTKMLLLKMVRRRIGVERMTLLRHTALRQVTKEQIEQAYENLRQAGLL